MKSSTAGQQAEAAVAAYLEQAGYRVLDANWKTRFCEIDIIAQRNEVIYFVEVKYRSKTSHGTGLEYITSQKLKQMKFAAELWNSFNHWDGDYRLMAAEVSGSDYQDVTIVEINSL